MTRYFLSVFFLSIGFSAIGQEQVILHDDLERSYLTHLPSDYDENNKYPLVLALHGGTGSASNLQNQSGLSDKADEEGFIVVYPNGLEGGFFNVRTWNAGWCCGSSSTDNIDDVGFISALMDELFATLPIDTQRVYVTGMSNGGYMSYRLACEIGHRIAAIAPVAASMSMEDCNTQEPTPIIHFHSYQDLNVLVEGGYGIGLADHYSPPLDSVFGVWSIINDCGIQDEIIESNNRFTHKRWGDCTCNTSIEVYISEDGGHSWPGGRRTLMGDPTSNFIDANDLMWEFFKKHKLECTTSGNNEVYTDAFKVFPNPTINKINITINDDKRFDRLAVIGLNGNKILEQNMSSSVSFDNIAKGLYWLQLSDTQSGNQAVTKILVL